MSRPTARWTGRLALAVPVAALLLAGTAVADDDAADTELDAAIAEVRAGACAPLQPDPIARRAAEISNRSTLDYLHHTASHVPVDDPVPVLHDLGSRADAAIQLQGYGPDLATAIGGALLQGHSTIRDCAYRVVGTNVIHDADRGAVLVVAVLADR